jgi:hypothetical protein
VSPDQTNWVEKLPITEFTMNSAVSSTTGYSPFKLNYGYLLTLLKLPIKSETKFYGIEQFADKARLNLSAAHDTIIAAQVHQTQQANKSRRVDLMYSPGDSVYLPTENLTLLKGRVKKLLPKYIGLYEILRVAPKKSSYEIRLPEELKRRQIHPVFHISRLRPHIRNDNSLFPGREAKSFYDFGLDEATEWIVRDIEQHNGPQEAN